MKAEERLAPGLYLVATPLGNLGDLSPRAREVLSRASFWAVESSSAAGRWLQILDPPKRPPVLSYRDGSRDKDAAVILKKLEQEGATVALMSDAGTPCVSDPGWHLVDLARKAGYPVHAIPGPCAAIQALTLAGFPLRRFCFEGFLPASGRHRRETLQRIDGEEAPLILYESPHALLDTLADLAEHLCPRPLYIGRELTKKFEESWRGTTDGAPQEWKGRRVQGEFTLVLGSKPKGVAAEDSVIPAETIALIRSLNMPTRSATAILKHFFPSASKKELYALFAQDGPEEGTRVR